MDTITVRVTDFEGHTHAIEAPVGWRLMEVIRDSGLNIKAECGGACACATCHVYVAPDWLPRLVPPSNDELLMLDDAMEVQEHSRLSCQIILAPELNGLEVTLAPNPE
jgi:2Fe-2S ferredoxin